MSLRGAVIGFGKIAESTHVPALAAAGLEVVAVAEAVPARREAAARALPGVRVVADLEALLAGGGRLDFVDVCTPPHLHFAAAQAAAGAGLHVLCEKPLVTRSADGAALATLAERQAVVVACVHNWTQAPILVRAREIVHSGALGELREMDLETLRTQPAAVATDAGNWRIDPERAGGGILFDHGWHGMSILVRTVGAKPRAVSGRIEKRKFRELAVEDTAEVRLEFAGGARARFGATWAAAQRLNRCRIVCARGTIEIENDRLRWPGGEETFEESLAGGGYRPAWTAGIVREFVTEIEKPALRGRALTEALTCLRLLVATYESAARGGAPITL